MTRKDYRTLASVIRQEVETADSNCDGSAVLALARVVRALAEELKRDNSNFRFDLFYAACGLDYFGELPRESVSSDR